MVIPYEGNNQGAMVANAEVGQEESEALSEEVMSRLRPGYVKVSPRCRSWSKRARVQKWKRTWYVQGGGRRPVGLPSRAQWVSYQSHLEQVLRGHQAWLRSLCFQCPGKPLKGLSKGRASSEGGELGLDFDHI